MKALAAAGGALALTLGVLSTAQAAPTSSGISGVHVVSGSKVWVGANSSASGLAFCPSGEVAISGGVDSGSFTGQSVVTSRPAGHNDQWLVRMYNNGHTQRFANYFYPYAVCAPVASVPGYQVNWGQKVWTSTPGGSPRGLAFCPSGQVALGGGVDSGAFTGQSMVTSRPAGHGDQWLVRMYNDGNTPRFANYFYPIVTCADQSTGAHVASWGQKVWTSTPGGSPRGLAFCPSGQVALGGGVDSGAFTGQSVVTSRPAGHGDQWLVRMYNDGNTPRFANYFYPIVVCAPTAGA